MKCHIFTHGNSTWQWNKYAIATCDDADKSDIHKAEQKKPVTKEGVLCGSIIWSLKRTNNQ